MEVQPDASGTAPAAIGRSYATLAEWAVALDAPGLYDITNIAMGYVCEDLTLTTLTISQGSSIGLSEIHLVGHPNYRHTGLAGTGIKLTFTSTSRGVYLTSTVKTYIEWLELYNNIT